MSQDPRAGEIRAGSWAEEDDQGDPPYPALTRQEAAEFRERHPGLSPWRVVFTQAALGAAMALVAWLVTQDNGISWSLLYGAAVVVVPAALLARATAGRLNGRHASANAVRFMFWEFAKIGVSVVMLMLASRVVQPLSWPALLVALAVCINVYWLALLWRPRAKEKRN